MSFAAYCALKKGKRTLLIDLDPQTNATFWSVGYDQREAFSKDHGSVADVLGATAHKTAYDKKKNIQEVTIKGVKSFGFDLVPSHLTSMLAERYREWDGVAVFSRSPS